MTQHEETPKENRETYRDRARLDALKKILDVIEPLPPEDQVRIVRTLAALVDGWD